MATQSIKRRIERLEKRSITKAISAASAELICEVKTMAELKPCPFCGGKAEILSGYGKYTVQCGSGGCMANISWCTNKDSAIKAWNRRDENDRCNM